MKQIIKNLQYVELSILNETTKEQSGILHLLMNETIEQTKEMKFFYDASFTSDKFLKHHFTYVQLAKKEKAKVLCDLHELQAELMVKNGNIKRALKIVTSLLETQLRKNNIERVINQWQKTGNRSLKDTRIFVE
ncbi:hypothetical protein AEA09_14795 [Lysinibacillus contaminans]|uniref:Transposase IS4-like domain-containing protein n=2 Tax=Lysinibacillus contaminans TaxID=1293441 RepID=A0ABR5JXT5_9BACI|nr:hypothetical protein AEA09_14795 [Lysinibacillus contaminans]